MVSKLPIVWTQMPLADVGESALPHVTREDPTVTAARTKLEEMLQASLEGPRVSEYAHRKM